MHALSIPSRAAAGLRRGFGRAALAALCCATAVSSDATAGLEISARRAFELPLDRGFVHLPTNEAADVYIPIPPELQGADWTTGIDVAWIALYDEGGMDAAVLSLSAADPAERFVVEANATGAARVGHVTLTGLGAAAGEVFEFTIVQSARPRERLVYGAGRNIYGESFADGTSSAIREPYLLEGYTGYADVRSSDSFTFLLKEDGSLQALREHWEHQLLPVASGVTAIDFIADELLYIDGDGDLYAASVADYDIYPGEDPALVASGVAKVIAGHDGYFYITDDGDLWGVGRSSFGRLGTGFSESDEPIFVAPDIVDAALSAYNGAYLTSDGDVYAMGKSFDNWFGLDDFADHYTPELIATNAREIAGTRHGLLIIGNDDSMGALGRDMAFGVDSDGAPVTFGEITPFAEDVATVAVSQDPDYENSKIFFETTGGQTYAAGLSFEGELGWGGYTPSELPWDVSPQLVGTGIETAHSAGEYTLFVNDDGSLAFAGLIPAHWSRSEPFDEYYSRSVHALPIDRIVAIDAYDQGAWLLTDDGKLFGVGRNGISHPNGSMTNDAPTLYEIGVSAVDGEGGLLFLADDTLTYYPEIHSGHPIHGAEENDPYSRAVSCARDIAVSLANIFWIDEAGDLYGLGDAYLGMLGDVDPNGDYTDTPVLIDTNVASVDAGWTHLAYLKTDGTAWTLGSDFAGQLGDGDLTPIVEAEVGGRSPFPFKVGSNVVGVWAAGLSTAFLTSDGALWGMGFLPSMIDEEGMLGLQVPTRIHEDGLPVVDADLSTYGVIAFATSDGWTYQTLASGNRHFFTNAYGDRKAVGVATSETSLYIFTSEVPSLDAESLLVEAAGSVENVGLLFDEPWYAFSTVPWIELDKQTSDGAGTDDTIALTIAPNNAGCPRRGWVSVGGGVIEVHQLGNGSGGDCDLDIFPTGAPSPSFGTVANAIEIEWTDEFAGSFETTYEIYRSPTSSFAQAELLAEGLEEPSYRDTTAAAGHVYFYWIRAVRDGAAVGYQGPAEGLRGIAPPEEVKASQGDFADRVEIVWQRSSGAQSYEIYRSTAAFPEQATLLADGILGTRYEDFDADPDQLYVYQVVALVDGRKSLRSELATGYSVDEGITSLRASDGLFTDRVAIEWDAFPGAQSYTLLRHTSNDLDAAQVIATGLTATAYDDPIDEANRGDTFYYWARPVVGGDTKSFSNADPGHASVPQQSGLLAWGDNSDDQAVPPPLDSGDLIDIAAGANHSLALKADGTVVGWGRNDHGQATPPVGLSGVVDIAAGYDHSLALKSDGTVVGWGNNAFGKATSPAMGRAVDIAAGADHSLALLADGSVAAWGSNDYGQTALPENLGLVVEIAAGAYHNIARRADGTIAVWGDNAWGQLQVPEEIDTVLAVASGWYHLIVILPDYSVVAWGRSDKGQLNVPTSVSPDGWMTVRSLAALAESADLISISGGLFHSIGLTAGGDVVTWGHNKDSQSTAPAGLGATSKISAGDTFNLALETPAAPRIENVATGPLSQAPGGNLLLKARATGAADLEYQWFRNGGAINGATSDTLALSDLEENDSGNYTVKATSGGQTVESAPIVLSVSDENLLPATLVGESLRALRGADGEWLIVGVQTDPPGLDVVYRHNGSTTLPSAPGEYVAQARIEESGYTQATLENLPLAVSNVENATTIELGNGATTVRFAAPLGFTATLLMSEDLEEWTPVATIPSGAETLQIHTEPTDERRYFRVVYTAP